MSGEHIATADVCDEHGLAAMACSTQFRSYGGRAAFSGLVETVRCRDDNVLVRRLLSERGDGRVLVVDGEGSLDRALLGDAMAMMAASNGWVGVIINGAVRDVARLSGIDLGVAAIGSNPQPSNKEGIGASGEPVSFGGATFRVGDTVYVDTDGVVVVPVR
jgi:regulator of ribonuclease activity A